MSRIFAPGWLAAAHLTASALAILWNLVVARRIARWRAAPRSIEAMTGLCGLLIAPGAFLAVAASSSLAGRALYTLAWIWPATTTLIAVQAATSVVRGYVPRASGVPVAAYDALVAVVAIVRYAIFLGLSVPVSVLTAAAAQTSALALGAHPAAALLPLYLYVPLLAPAAPSRRWRLATIARGATATLATTWTALILLMVPLAHHAVAGYERFTTDQLQERPAPSFAIGLKVFPTLSGGGPSALALANDLDLAQDLDVQAVSVYIAPGQARLPLLDSVAHTLDETRRGGARLIVALDLPDDAPAFGPPRPESALRVHLMELELVVRRLQPDYLVPGVPRSGFRPRIPLSRWEHYLSDAAAIAHRLRPRTRVLPLLDGFSTRDSALYAWAVRSESGLDGVGFRMVPSDGGAMSLDARLAAADRWMRTLPSRAEHWVLESAGLPMAHGERNQALALWRTIAWATRHPNVSGVVIYEASDYEAPVGLRTTGGRLRPAADMVDRAITSLGDTTGGQ